jgi:kynurenine formamidase
VGDPLARRLIDSARKKQVADLSVVLSTEMPVTWPGRGAGRHREPYLKVSLFLATNLGIYHQTHTLDAHAGTHLVPPSYALPVLGFDNKNYAPEVQAWLAEYESKYGPRATSTATTEQVPLAQTCGWVRVIDVKHRIGTTEPQNWPQSPEITVADIEENERQHGPIKPGMIVIFHSGYTDTFFKPLPDGFACMADPLNAKREGWPAPGPDAIVYLAGKGVRCVATDGPTLGGAEPKRALATYWALGSKELVAVEFLTGVGKLPAETYFIFAPIKIRGCHGGPGRAIALF